MLRKTLAATYVIFFIATVSGTCPTARCGEFHFARDRNAGNQLNGADRGFRGIHTFKLFKKDPPNPCQPKRYFDATGRWTGDGCDSMSTTQPPCPPN